MSARAESRRSFLRRSAALSGAAALPWALQGCSHVGGSTPTTSKLYVLAAGPSGKLRRSWTRFDTLTLERADSTFTYGGTHTQLNAAVSAAAAADGTFWVADKGNARILHLDSGLRLLGAITTIAGIRLLQPSGIAILPDGRLVVSDILRGRVAIVSQNGGDGQWMGVNAGDYLSTGWRPHWATETDNRIMDDPRFVGVSSGGSIVVFDTAARRLVRFATSGEATGSVRLAGAATGLAISPDGTPYVCDLQARNVNRIDLATGQASALFSGDQLAQIGGIPRRLTWQAGSGDGVENLIVSFL